jgi:hypothetical protein
MPARRCAIGCQSWPDEPIFSSCTHCHEPTRRVNNIEPDIEREEAKLLKLHDLFDRYYERRCATLGIPSEGPLVEDAEVV